MIESGFFYSNFIDPLLVGLRKRISQHLVGGERVIDVACGTGAQAFEFALKANRVVGVDLSQSMINYAQTKSLKRQVENVEFLVADATNLSQFSNKEFDVATMSLALHQFPPKYYTPILNELKRVAKCVIILDYAVPLGKNAMGYACKIIEFLAGREHNRCFKTYYKAGGLKTILPENDLQIQHLHNFGKGALQLVICDTP